MTTIPSGQAPEALAKIQDLNEIMLEAGGRTAQLVLDLYAATLEAVAAGQEQAANETDAEWIAGLLEAQARFTRELARVAAWAQQQLP
jgi:hypothetical protein